MIVKKQEKRYKNVEIVLRVKKQNLKNEPPHNKKKKEIFCLLTYKTVKSIEAATAFLNITNSLQFQHVLNSHGYSHSNNSVTTKYTGRFTVKKLQKRIETSTPNGGTSLRNVLQ